MVASVHAVFNLPEAEMTKRIIKAISNPHVTMLGHLTGRLLLQRESYAVDIPAILDAAAVDRHDYRTQRQPAPAHGLALVVARQVEGRERRSIPCSPCQRIPALGGLALRWPAGAAADQGPML
ncbi:MAG: hypothetical protein QM796_04080 [Chthoniobacteraceae bacterium]